MYKIRTTLKIEERLKLECERLALETKRTLQDIFNDALYKYLQSNAKINADKLVFQDHPIDTRLDNLRRSDYYDDF